MADGLDELLHQLPPAGAVELALGGDHPLVNAPGRLDLDMLVGIACGEQGLDPLVLFVGEQVRAGVQDSAGRVKRVAGAASVAVQVLLDPAPAPVQSATGQAGQTGVGVRTGLLQPHPERKRRRLAVVPARPAPRALLPAFVDRLLDRSRLQPLSRGLRTVRAGGWSRA